MQFYRQTVSCHSYISHSQALLSQLGIHSSPSHGDRTPQLGTDIGKHRKRHRTPGDMLGVDIHVQVHTVYSHVQSSSVAGFIQLQFPLSYTHSLLSHLAPLQPGSHSQRPVTWWQLELRTQSHLGSQLSPKNPLEQASNETHKRLLLECSVRVRQQNMRSELLLLFY